jgi:hypothetical protein
MWKITELKSGGAGCFVERLDVGNPRTEVRGCGVFVERLDVGNPWTKVQGCGVFVEMWDRSVLHMVRMCWLLFMFDYQPLDHDSTLLSYIPDDACINRHSCSSTDAQ